MPPDKSPPPPPETPSRSALPGVLRAVAAAKERFARIFAPPRPATEPLPELCLLPWDVNYSLRYNDRTLNGGEIVQLFGRPWGDVALYLSLKAFRDDPRTEALLLGAIVKESRAERPLYYTAARPFLESLPKGARVAAGKTNQVSMYGPRTYRGWADRMSQAALAAGETPCLVSHSGYLLLDAFLSRMDAGTILTVDPRRIGEGHGECGFRISLDGKNVAITGWGPGTDLRSAVGSRITLVDDRIGKGETLARVKAALSDAPGQMPHMLDERYLLDARDGIPRILYGE